MNWRRRFARSVRDLIAGAGIGLLAAIVTSASLPHLVPHVPSALANWGSSGCSTSIYSQCIANNSSHSVNINSSVAGQERTAVIWAIGELDLVAGITAYQTTGPADVVVYEVNEPGINYRAWTACSPSASYGGSNPRRYCYPQITELNTGKYGPTQFNTDNKRYTIALKEMGHSMGLRDSSQTDDPNDWDISAMRYYSVQPDVLRRFTSHDKSHLTANY